MTLTKENAMLIKTVRAYISKRVPELADAPIRLHRLDGPPGGPRYSASAELCCANVCPYGVSADESAAGRCSIHTCSLRRSIRLLLDAQGTVLQEQSGDIHWS
jgi:hypothetical protein